MFISERERERGSRVASLLSLNMLGRWGETTCSYLSVVESRLFVFV